MLEALLIIAAVVILVLTIWLWDTWKQLKFERELHAIMSRYRDEREI